MSSKISNEIKEQIPILYEQYHNKTKVAELLNISTATVNKYLAIYNGAPAEKVRKKSVIVDKELENKINELFSQYRNMSKVAKELNLSLGTVRNHLNEENLECLKKINDDRDALFYYIYRLFGEESEDQPVSEWNIIQMVKFKEQGINYRAQLLILKYIYEVKRRPVKPEYRTIGLIPFYFNEAAAYYESQSKRQKEILDAIERQLEQDRIEINFNPSDYMGKKKKRKQIDLNSIEVGEGDAKD